MNKRYVGFLMAVFCLMNAAWVMGGPGQDRIPGEPLGRAAARDFESVKGKDWFLEEIQGERRVFLDRAALAADAMGDVYSLRFDEERVSGKAAPNRYFAPYTRDGWNLSIEKPAATLMMGLKDPEGLKEREYIDLLGGVTGWRLREGLLELESANEEGNVVLIFAGG